MRIKHYKDKLKSALIELRNELNKNELKYQEYKRFELVLTGNCINPEYDNRLYDPEKSNSENLNDIYANPEIIKIAKKEFPELTNKIY
jgi:hypothetical protein